MGGTNLIERTHNKSFSKFITGQSSDQSNYVPTNKTTVAYINSHKWIYTPTNIPTNQRQGDVTIY
jgi:hypothetical protein